MDKMDQKEALELIAWRVREALQPKTSTANKEFYAAKDLILALNEILAIAKATGIE